MLRLPPRRRILFAEVVIDSDGMPELPALVTALAPEQLIELRAAGAVGVRADGWTLAKTETMLRRSDEATLYRR